jgi:hypothetical protein
MAVTKETLTNLQANMHTEVSEWTQNAKRLYEKFQKGNLTRCEKVEWQRIQDRNYLDFADTVEAETGMEFLRAYLQANSELKKEFHQFAARLFTPGQFATIAVRLNSVEVLELGVDYFIDYCSTAHDPNLITDLTLIYRSAGILNQDPDLFLKKYLHFIADDWTLSFVRGFLNHDKTEKLNSRFKAVYEPNFGYIKEQKQHTIVALKNRGKRIWVNFLSLFSMQK